MHLGLQALRAKIRGFQAAGSSIRHKISKSKGLHKHGLWIQKRQLGVYNREHLIAYGLLRGLEYERIEKCAKSNTPNAAKILELIKAHGDWQTAQKWTIELVKKTLSRVEQ